jgi:predicted O-linked N-acetylglucosamine transferase (SPINDLY family)
VGQSLPAGPPQNAALQRALEALRTGKVIDAENLLKQVLRAEQRNVAALNLLAIVLMQLGRLAEAESYFQRALKEQPRSDATLYNYGIALKALNRPAEALERFNQAAAINAGVAETWNNRGTVLNDLKRYHEAIADFEKAIRLNPRYVEAFCNKANSYAALEQFGEALSECQRALELKPDLAEAWCGCGDAYWNLNRYDEASAAFDRAVALKPGFAEARVGRGNALAKRERYDEALAAYDKALALKPDSANAWLGRGSLFTELKRHDEALAAYEKALALKPDLANAWLGRGNVFTELKRYDEAVAAYEKALGFKPDLANAWLGRGNVFAELRRHDEAVTAYDKALAVKPDLAEAWLGRGNVATDRKRHDEAFAAFDKAFALKPDLEAVEGARLHASMQLCDWSNIEPSLDHLINSIRGGRATSAPFVPLGLTESPEVLLQCARLWVSKKYPPAAVPIWKGEIYKHDRIRIGYVSADFHEHATAYLMAGAFECHDKEKFEITAISIGPNDKSAIRRRLERSFDRFLDCRSLGDRDIANEIKSAEIDVLVDLKGFTQDARTSIFAYRAAPVQVNYLGYPGTMGAGYIDYIIGDNTVFEKADEEFYSEKLVRLPHTYQPNDRKRIISEAAPTRAACELPETGLVFCCFNSNYKIMPGVFDCWMRILKHVPGSVLWLLEGHTKATSNLRKEAAMRGVSPDRLIFAKWMPLAEHLARHRHGDLFLDTLPCNAHTTASDALWAGLPVITCLGSAFPGRVAGSLLRSAGLGELISTSLEDYEALALKIARDPELLAALKAKLARNRDSCPLFDTARFTRDIERAYSTMVEIERRGEDPYSFSVEP